MRSSSSKHIDLYRLSQCKKLNAEGLQHHCIQATSIKHNILSSAGSHNKGTCSLKSIETGHCVNYFVLQFQCRFKKRNHFFVLEWLNSRVMGDVWDFVLIGVILMQDRIRQFDRPQIDFHLTIARFIKHICISFVSLVSLHFNPFSVIHLITIFLVVMLY